MVGIWIPVRLDPDLFGQILILEIAMAVRSQLDSELYPNSPDLRTLILHLWMRCFIGPSFKAAEKSVREQPLFRPKLLLHRPISTTIL
jgi:hypothetical protein